MPTPGDRASDVIGDAVAKAVRLAVDEVGRAPMGELSGVEETDTDDDTNSDDEPLPRVTPDADPADPYAVLGVARSASWEQIVAARKRLARAWHPDTGGDEERLRSLNAAFAELRVRRGR